MGRVAGLGAPDIVAKSGAFIVISASNSLIILSPTVCRVVVHVMKTLGIYFISSFHIGLPVILVHLFSAARICISLLASPRANVALHAFVPLCIAYSSLGDPLKVFYVSSSTVVGVSAAISKNLVYVLVTAEVISAATPVGSKDNNPSALSSVLIASINSSGASFASDLSIAISFICCSGRCGA